MFRKKPSPRHVETTPVFDRATRAPIWSRLLRLALVIGLPLAALATLGQPALRIEYSWYGHRDAPVYTRCLYLALDGWHDIHPVSGTGHCPLVTALPIDLVAFLSGR